MDFIRQYIKIISYALIGLVFAFASFYFLTNAYHYLEIRKDYDTDFNSEPLLAEINKKMANVNSNVSKYNANTYTGKIKVNQLTVVSQNLRQCVSIFNNDVIKDMKDKKTISIVDVYNLRESYENTILNECIVDNLYWATTVDESNFASPYLVANKEAIKLQIDSLLGRTSYLKKDLLNNSSYFYSTSIASSSIKNNTKDGFYEVMSAYNDAATFVEYISEWFKNEVGGYYD